jgi:Tol biopolymer transport system component
MKNAIYFLFISAIILSIVFGCQKSKQIDNPQSIVLKDTIFIHDTIIVSDTIFLIDSIIFSDTIVLYDTIYVQDTSEFDYLFKHYELDVYEILFYTINLQKNPYQICRMNSNSHNIEILAEGYKDYPIWSQDSTKFIYVDFSNWAIVEEDFITHEVTEICSIDRNMMFLRYFPIKDMFLFSYKIGSESKIGALDYRNNSIIELTDASFDEVNPVCSDVDDWVYFSRSVNGTYDIYRIKIDGSNEELVYDDENYNLSSFSMSSDGKFLITPKYLDGKGFVVFYDVERHQIIHELELPIDGHPMYASLSPDNKAIFFVNGTPYNYSEPRNIYRMALDRTQLYQLTNYSDKLAIRPIIR